MDLIGRRILITGASSGIGRACAILASQLGATCLLVARRQDALEQTRQMMERAAVHEILPCDLSKLETIPALMDVAIKGGKLNGLVHASGVCPAAPIGYQSLDEAKAAMEINYFSFLALMQAVFKKRYFEAGSVVAVSSIAAEVGWGGVSAYAGTKGALSASVRSLAIEFAPKQIRVNAIQPSNIKTPMFDAVAGEVNTAEGLAELKKKQPLGIGEPEDVANAVCFLLSNAAKFITGTNLVVDGGYLAQ